MNVKSNACRSATRLLCTAANSGDDEKVNPRTGLEGLTAAEIEALPDLGSFMREGVETIEEIMAQDIRSSTSLILFEIVAFLSLKHR